MARIVDGDIRPLPAPSEVEYLSVWNEWVLGTMSALETAVLGGALSDRLAWVFVAGYQGAISQVFPKVQDDGWACFAVSEDASGELPGLSIIEIKDSVRLNGHKTWVAGSDHVRRLVVSVNHNEEQRFILVSREEEGVSIETYETASFLSELSQGRATFEDTTLPMDAFFGMSNQAQLFGVAEPLHVLAALNAFMLSQARCWDGSSHVVSEAMSGLHAAISIADGDMTSAMTSVGLAGFCRQTIATAEAFESLAEHVDEELYKRWTFDRRLLEMFRRGTERKAETALVN